MKNDDKELLKPDGAGNNQHEESQGKKPGDYLKIVKAHIRNGKPGEALPVVRQALTVFPDDPIIFSYFGCLQAIVDKKCRTGIDNCRKAISVLQKKGAFREEVFYPVLYLNLGKAYLASGMKKEAVESFTRGLKYSKRDIDLKKEMQALGVRKDPPLAFLDRSNPVNKYLGKVVDSLDPPKRSR
jgi:tetratricopeptide (TPR) repeat protein